MAISQFSHVAFEVGARHVVEQKIALQLEEFAEPLLEVRFDRFFVGQEPVERGVESIGVHLLGGHAQEIFQHRAAIPLLLDVQFARRLAEPGDGKNRRHRPPRHVLTTRGQKLRQEPVESEHPPQPPGQPDVTEITQPLEPDVLEADLHLFFFACITCAWRIEERAALAGELLRRPAGARRASPNRPAHSA